MRKHSSLFGEALFAEHVPVGAEQRKAFDIELVFAAETGRRWLALVYTKFVAGNRRWDYQHLRWQAWPWFPARRSVNKVNVSTGLFREQEPAVPSTQLYRQTFSAPVFASCCNKKYEPDVRDQSQARKERHSPHIVAGQTCSKRQARNGAHCKNFRARLRLLQAISVCARG